MPKTIKSVTPTYTSLNHPSKSALIKGPPGHFRPPTVYKEKQTQTENLLRHFAQLLSLSLLSLVLIDGWRAEASWSPLNLPPFGVENKEYENKSQPIDCFSSYIATI